MGWNDRLPENPNIPYESQDDRDAYDNWAMYSEMLHDEEATGGLTSNNIQPGAVSEPLLARGSSKEMQNDAGVLDRLRELVKQTAAQTNENENSR